MVKLPQTPPGGFVPRDSKLPPTPQPGFVPRGSAPEVLDPSKPIIPRPPGTRFPGGGGGSAPPPTPTPPPVQAGPTAADLEAQRQAEVSRQAEIQRQQDIAIGSVATTRRDTGEVVTSITQNVGESRQAFIERQRSLGAGIRQEQPEATRRFTEAREKALESGPKVTEVSERGSVLEEQNLSFAQRIDKSFKDFVSVEGTPGIKSEQFSGGSFVGGAFKIGDIIQKKVASKLPEGSLAKRSLEIPISPRASELIIGTTDSLAKFALFSPLIATTPEVISKLVSSKQITPVTETSFNALIKNVDDIQRINVATKTRIGGEQGITIQGVSRQVSTKVDDLTSITVGKGVSGGGRGLQEFRTIGAGKITGKAVGTKTLVQSSDDLTIQLQRNLGKGFEVQSVSQPTFKLTEGSLRLKLNNLISSERGATSLTKDFSIQTIPKTQTSIRFPSGTITTTETIVPGKIAGVIKQTSDDALFQVIGTTDDLTKTLKPEGFVRGFSRDQIDVAGNIRILKDISKDSGTKILKGSGTKTPLSVTFGEQATQLTTQQTSSVLSQVSAQRGSALSQVIKSVDIPSSVSATKTIVSSTTATLPKLQQEVTTDSRFVIPQARIPSLSEAGKINQLGIFTGRLGTATLTDTLTSQKSKQKLQTKQQTKQAQNVLVTTQQDILNRQSQKQRALLRLNLRQQQRTQQQRAFGIPSINLPIPKTKTGFIKIKTITPKLSKQPTSPFKVFGRRFGKFKAIGAARTEKGAFAIGKKFLRTTLGASIKIPKSKVLKLPGFRTKKTKEGVIFIEPKRRRLKKRGAEVLEIQTFKKVSKRRKKK